MSDGLQQEETYEEMIARSPVLLNRNDATPPAIARALVLSLVEDGQLPAELVEAACVAIHAREVSGGCTALAEGIAIPHGCLDVPRPLVAIAIHAEGVDCGAIDGQLSRIFILQLNRQGSRAHVRFLAGVNRRLLRAEVRAAILAARTPEVVKALLCG